jgi:5'-3' exonuclease
MGIPYYFYVLTKKYNNILINSIDIKPDIFCFDFNGIIHPIALEELNDEKILNKLWLKVEKYSNEYKAKNIHICVDGIAPFAKIIQQRKRRYLSAYKKKIDNEKIIWDTNAITPGTEFMNKLNTYFTNKTRYNINKDIIYHYSGSNINGEGEHKIFKIIKNLENDKTILIHGLDADLIILSLMSHKKNIYLMREKQENDILDYTYININALRNAIINDLIIKWDLNSNNYIDNFSNNSINLIESYCVMCSLLGNDFIPHLLTINLKNNGLDELLMHTKLSIKLYDLLVIDGDINHKCLTEIFNRLSLNEDTGIFKITENYINKKHHNTKSESDFYAIKNKDKIAYEIQSDFKKWKYIYYSNKFNTNIYIDSSIIFEACENYIKGIYWTYSYYKYNIIDHTWYYPYNFPPIIKDISNHCNGNSSPTIINKGTFISNEAQLLIVLPKSSNNLLKNSIKKYTNDINLGLYHMFPNKFIIHTYLKNHLWECCPELPKININYINSILNN